MKITQGRLKQIIKEEMESISSNNLSLENAAADMFGDPDEEGGMAKSELFKIENYAKELNNMLQDSDQLPAWVQSKITKCAAMIGDVKHFLEGEIASMQKSPEEPATSTSPVLENEQEDEISLNEQELEEIIKNSLSEIFLNEKKKKKLKVNPWAVCTATVGRENKDKYERCVLKVKKQKKQV